MLQEVFGRLQDKGINLSVTDAFKERLVEEGFNPLWSKTFKKSCYAFIRR